MPTLPALYAAIKRLCDDLYDLRHSPRPADADWRQHRLSLEHARQCRDAARQSVDACIQELGAVKGLLPASWIGDDPQASKYIRLKRSLGTVKHWLHEFQRPFRGYKMPMHSDAQDQHDDPADVESWKEVETTVRTLGAELKDWIDLHDAKPAAGPAAAPQPPAPAVKGDAEDAGDVGRPVEGPREKQNAANVLSKEAKALAALADHPDWTDEQIAQAAGCNRQSLYRMKKYVAAKRILKGGQDLMPSGSKDGESGNVEAWDTDGDDE